MERLWAPWRMAYIDSGQESSDVCIFCQFPSEGAERFRERLILCADDRAFAIMNKFPYNNGHVMVVPRAHVDDPGKLSAADYAATTELLRRATDAVRAALEPHGFNLGMNLGRVAGAGIDRHCHYHIVPRWNGDTNFMPVIADAKVISEGVPATYERLLPRFAGICGPPPADSSDGDGERWRARPVTLWSWFRRFAGLWGFAAFLVLVAILSWRVLLPFVLAVMLAFVLSPAVDRIASVKILRRPVPRFAAVLALYLVILSVLGLFVGLVLPRLSGDFARLFHEAPGFFAKVKTDYAPRASRWLETHLPSEGSDGDGPRPERKIEVRETAPGRYEISLESMDLEVSPLGKGHYAVGPRRDDGRSSFDDLVAQLARATETEAMAVLRLGQRFVAAVVRAVASLVLILMVAAFLLVDLDSVHAFMRSLVPDPHRLHYDVVLAQINRGLSGVIRGQFMICLVNSVLTYVGLLLLHVKYPLLLGMVAGVMSLVPVFGSILSSIPIVAVALVGGADGIELTRGLMTLGWIILIHLLEANFLNPKIIGNAAKIHPLVVVFALVVGEHSGGLIGALIAVPVASIVQTLFLFFFRRREEAPLHAADQAGG